jgi:methionine synthase I (cobalamin-dependent)
MSSFGEALASGRPLPLDGAMGTELFRAGLRPGECHELWNVTRPEAVRAIHEAYARAGASCLLTNTFQANPAALGRHGLAGRLAELQGAGVALARAAGGPGSFVLGDVGPLVVASGEDADPALVRQTVAGLLGADALLLETWSSPQALAAAAAAAGCGLPVLLSLTYRRGDRGLETFSGHAPGWFAERARAAGVAALGVNCGRDVGPDELLEVVRRYRERTDLPLLVRPNAGTPAEEGGSWVYPRSPAALAERLPELLAAGATLVGGCCGTTPEHVAAFAAVLDAWPGAARPT